MLHSVERNVHEWGVGDSEDVARLEIHHSNERKDLLRQSVLPLRASQTGAHVDHIASGEHRGAIAANQVDCKQLRFVGQGDAYRAIVAKVEVSIRSNVVYGISPHACRGALR